MTNGKEEVRTLEEKTLLEDMEQDVTEKKIEEISKENLDKESYVEKTAGKNYYYTGDEEKSFEENDIANTEKKKNTGIRLMSN